jgi:hypothetical protein
MREPGAEVSLAETFRERQARLYEEAVSARARADQEALAKQRHPCCGEPRDGDHHLACSKRPEDAHTVVHEAQERLA